MTLMNYKSLVLLVFPSVFSLTRRGELMTSVKEKLLTRDIVVHDIILEDVCLVLVVSDVVEAVAITLEMFGVDKVAIAKRIPKQFRQIVRTIVMTGQKTILSREKFFVKVEVSQNDKLTYVQRDLEFAASGELIGKLSRTVKAIPAKNEYDADKLVLTYLGKNSAYVCIQVNKGMGGITYNSQKEDITCSIHNITSTISCLKSLKCGFAPNYLIPYTNHCDLTENVKLFGFVANKSPHKRYKIRVGRIDLPSGINENLELMFKESVCAEVLALLPGKGIIIPLSASFYPLWFVKATIKRVFAAGKIPWMPLAVSTNSIYYDAKELGLEDKISFIDKLVIKTSFDKRDYERFQDKIDTISRLTFKGIKIVSLEIGPNYLHDIVDSI
jgi:hypothetical protein